MLNTDYLGTPQEGLWTEVQEILNELEDPRGRWEDTTGELACLVQRLRSVLATVAEDY